MPEDTEDGTEMCAPMSMATEASVGARHELILYDPRAPGRPLSVERLYLESMALQDLWDGAEVRPEAVAAARGVAVLPGDRVGRIRGDPTAAPSTPLTLTGQDELHLGNGLRLAAEDGSLRADRCGYLSVAADGLEVRGPIWVDGARQRAYWLWLGSGALPLTVDLLRRELEEAGVVAGERTDRLKELVDKVRDGTCSRGAYLVAEGRAAVPGQPARIEWLVDLDRKAGRILADGSVDLRDLNYITNVQAGQVLARRWPATAGTPGLDLAGREIPAAPGQDRVLEAGENVRIEMEGDEERFVAAADGAVRRRGATLSVGQVLHIQGDVDYNKGNLDFEGELLIDGSVRQGFRVRGARGVRIGGTVEDAAHVESDGDIVVAGGIVGRKTHIQAGGSVVAPHVQEARVHAGGDIELGRFAYHAELLAEGRITITKGGGRRGGSALGGHLWAKEGIELFLAGSPAQVETFLAAGVSPELARELDATLRHLERTEELVERLLRRFGLQHIDVARIRALISATTGPHRKLLAESARQLARLAQAYQQLLARRAALEDKLNLTAATPEIQVRDRAYPKVRVRVGEHERLLTEEVVSPRFHVVDGQLRSR